MGNFVSYKCFQCCYDILTKCALVSTKDVILNQLNLAIKAVHMYFTAMRNFFDDKELTEQEQIALSDDLKNEDKILAYLNKIAVDLNIYPMIRLRNW
ncbi:unnamed protein product [Dovyalis caffra]|uniref:Uncharacterized protein n=1 Tax=Dovyalis caffra TaxID=77055 RepID=A0AAV1S4G7_9ROSI|nr:unnamed protein product [Dovyalis caffra]